MRLHHVLEAQQFNKDLLDALFTSADTILDRAKESSLCKGRILTTLFYEPSTRTRLSFESAMLKLGGSVISTENAANFSSAAKGETLEDSIRVVAGYGDVIVIRHFELGAAQKASLVSSVPVINAGDGTGQHPTQSLLDLYTIKKELGRLDHLSVAMVGDLANGRTVRSLAYLLAKYEGMKFYFVAPPNVRMRDDIKDYCSRHGVAYEECENLEDVARKADVIYQTRIQRERFLSVEDYEKASGVYIIGQETLDVMQKHAIILHPLPRVDEIKPEVDSDPRAAYFRQAYNGLIIRMALLDHVLNG